MQQTKPGEMYNAMMKKRTTKKKKITPIASNRAYGTNMTISKAQQNSKNPSWVGAGPKKMRKKWIAGAIKKPGALRASLGVKKGAKIPAGKLAMAAKKGGKEGKRARLAETLKSFHHKKMCKTHKKTMCKTCR